MIRATCQKSKTCWCLAKTGNTGPPFLLVCCCLLLVSTAVSGGNEPASGEEVQNSEEARTVDLHGDNHPPVSLRLGSTSLDYGRNAGEMVLQVYVVGAVHGFSYQIIVQVMTEAGHVQHQGVTDFSMDNGPGMEVAVVLPLPEARDRYRLAIGMWDSYIGIQGQPEALVARKDIQLSLPPRRTSPVAVPKKDSQKSIRGPFGVHL